MHLQPPFLIPNFAAFTGRYKCTPYTAKFLRGKILVALRFVAIHKSEPFDAILNACTFFSNLNTEIAVFLVKGF